MEPTNNFLLVSIPERFVRAEALRGDDKLLIRPYQMTPGLLEQIQAGHGDIPFELDEEAERTLVREGLVLALPPQLTEDLYVCAGPFEKPRTGKDIHPEVEVGDTVHLDSAYLTDENEIQPGIYRLPYTAVIAIIEPYMHLWKLASNDPGTPRPIGGYALLSRVYPNGAEKQQDGSYAVQRRGLWEAVAPIRNEGVVEYRSYPLGGTPSNVAQEGDRVLFEGYPRLETIRGTEYIVVQQDTIAAVLDRPDFTKADKEWIDKIDGSKLTLADIAVLPLDSLHYDA
jgi:co-chaperonin GroES (HSP10)